MTGKPALGPEAPGAAYVQLRPPKGGVIHQGVTGTFDTLNPFSLKGKSAQGLSYVYDRLMGRSWDEPFTLYPLIAAKADVPEDRSSITFTIDPRAKFHNGAPITVDDVIFSFETLRDHGRPNMRRVYKIVTSVERVGTDGVRFSLGPDRDRETVMILAMMPVLSKADWQGKDFNQTILNAPVSSGPYKIATVDPGRRIVLERVKDYWAADLLINRGLHNADRLVYDYFRDDTVAHESFQKGDLNYRIEYDPARWARTMDQQNTATTPYKTISIPHQRVERMWGFVFNTRRAPFDSRAVRRALSLMMDYDWINRNLFRNQYKITDSYFENSVLGAEGEISAVEGSILLPFRDSLPPEVFGDAWHPPDTGTPEAIRNNVRQADQILKDAGYVIRDGKRVNEKTGAPMRFEILLTSPADEKIALSFKRSLARLGVDINLRTLDAAAYRDRMNDYDFDMTLTFWQNSLSPGTEQALYWGCQAAKEPGRFNYAGICEPAIDSIVKAIPNVKTREQMIVHTRALDRILTWNYYAIPLFYSGVDTVAYRAPLVPPARPALYGNVLESWVATIPKPPEKAN